MRAYTYTEARQKLAVLLDRALEEGEVRIERRDGQTFVVRPEARAGSPLDVEGIDLGPTAEEIVAFIHEGPANPAKARFGRLTSPTLSDGRRSAYQLAKSLVTTPLATLSPVSLAVRREASLRLRLAEGGAVQTPIENWPPPSTARGQLSDSRAFLV